MQAFDYRGQVTAEVQANGRAGEPWRGLARLGLDGADLWPVKEPGLIAELDAGELRLSADAGQFLVLAAFMCMSCMNDWQAMSIPLQPLTVCVSPLNPEIRDKTGG